MYVHCVFVQYAAVCHYRPFVCMSGAPARVRSGHRIYDQITPGEELHTHIQTDGNDIRPHTAQTHNGRTSTESNVVTAQSTAHEHPEDGRKYGPKHVGATLLKYFNMLLSVLNINVNLCFNPLNPELNPICYLLALLAHHFLHVSRIRVKSLTIRLLTSYIYIYGAPILDDSRSHTTTHHSR